MSGGGQLIIETGNADIGHDEIPPGSGGEPGPHVRLTVRDTGVGMDEQTAQRIFEPFFTTKEKGKGTGLGLSTVYGIVSHLQGFLRVRSQPGHGSEFNLYLPLNVAATQLPAASPVEPETFPEVSETVLVVDDQEIVRDFVAESLRMAGYSVLEARGGLEALQVIEQNCNGIHLMMTDVMMPGMGGTELAAHANVVCPSLKVLFMTGYADGSGDGVEVLTDKDEVIMKPFTPEELEVRVRSLLNASRR
jgi:CheY-like chemotaxis protein